MDKKLCGWFGAGRGLNKGGIARRQLTRGIGLSCFAPMYPGHRRRQLASGRLARPCRESILNVMRTRKTLGPKPVIGLVGGIGCGKSLVARLLGQLGCAVVDADALAHDALQTAAVRDELTAWWGSGILSLDGTVSRKAVGRKVFGNPSELKRLEGVIHPFVNAARRELRNQYTADPKVLAIVEDCPLLLETGLDRQCDVLIYVSATRANRLRRLAETRGWDESELDGREKNQLPLDKKEMVADYTIDNNAGEEECLLQVRRVFSKILQDLA